MHIILIGMPGCGKSTVGRALAAARELPFTDLDVEIERAAGRTIAGIFAAEGEEYFRERETEALGRACSLESRVIAAGGGIVLRSVNMALAKEFGVVVYLGRSCDTIQDTADLSGRPLLAARPERLAELFSVRRPLYEKYADIRVQNEGSVEDAAERIWEGYSEILGHKRP